MLSNSMEKIQITFIYILKIFYEFRHLKVESNPTLYIQADKKNYAAFNNINYINNINYLTLYVLMGVNTKNIKTLLYCSIVKVLCFAKFQLTLYNNDLEASEPK